jgi:uncharacterized membrane protein YidH (DUF202 family)
MQQDRRHASIDETKRASECLANERTFLAWIRTSVAVVSLGFVLARFGVWLRELAVHREPQVQTHRPGISLPMGVAMMTLGGLLTILAAWSTKGMSQTPRRCPICRKSRVVAQGFVAKYGASSARKN